MNLEQSCASKAPDKKKRAVNNVIFFIAIGFYSKLSFAPMHANGDNGGYAVTAVPMIKAPDRVTDFIVIQVIISIMTISAQVF